MLVFETNKAYRKRAIPRRSLVVGGINLTERCNLNCIHCFVRSDQNDSQHKELNTKQVLNVINQMRAAGVVFLNLTGGEPLLRPDFKEIYLFAKKRKFAICVSSNATLLTKDMIGFFKKYPPISLEISCYGVTQGTYESVTRTSGSFAMYQKALKMLQGSGVMVVSKFISMKKNYKEAAEAEVHARQMGMSYQCACFLWLRLDRDRSKNALIKRQRLNAEETADLFKIMGEDPQRFFLPVAGCDALEECGAASLGCMVDSRGWLKPCNFFGEHKISLKENNFQEAWRSLALERTPMQKKLLACGNCRHKAYCKWCPAASFVETGSSEKKIRYLCKLMDDLTQMGVLGSS